MRKSNFVYGKDKIMKKNLSQGDIVSFIPDIGSGKTGLRTAEVVYVNTETNMFSYVEDETICMNSIESIKE
jgi:tRNA A37 threonylcarbamoyladenosine biosynthesis protein TsaE